MEILQFHIINRNETSGIIPNQAVRKFHDFFFKNERFLYFS